MFAGKPLIMIKTALTGTDGSCQKYMDIIRKMPDFLVSGIFFKPLNDGSNPEPLEIIQESAKLYQLIEMSDILIVTNDAGKHFDTISLFLKSSRHVLISPDTSLSFSQIKILNEIAEEAGVLLRLHHNTFNSSIKEKFKELIKQPEYIYLKLQIKNPESSLNKIIYEELLRSIYIIFELNPVNMAKYHITSVPVYSDTPYIIDLVIQFENGSAAHIIISECFNKESEKLDIIGENKTLSFDPVRNELLTFDHNTRETLNHSLNTKNTFSEAEENIKKFLSSINNKNDSENRFTNGIFIHQIASSILQDIHPSMAKNKMD